MIPQPAPVVLVAAVAALAAVALAASDGFSHWTVPAAGPWAVVGGAVVVAGRAGVYEPVGAPALTTPLLSAVAAVAAASWLVVGWVATDRRAQHRERYVAAAGVGAAAVLVTVLLAHFGVPAGRLVWVLVVPMAAAVTATVGLLAAGFLVASLITDLRFAGFYTLGAVTFEGATSAVARAGFGADGLGLLETVLGAGTPDLAWWAFVLLHLVAGLVVVGVCGRLSRWQPAAGRAAVFVVSVLATWSATVVLLAAVALG